MSDKLIVPGGPKIEMLDCDVCHRKLSSNQITILPNEFAQSGINKSCLDCFVKAATEFYEGLRAIFKRMQEESEWRK